MERDPRDACAVQLRLDVRDPREDVGGQIARGGLESGPPEQAFDLRVVAMIVPVPSLPTLLLLVNMLVLVLVLVLVKLNL